MAKRSPIRDDRRVNDTDGTAVQPRTPDTKPAPGGGSTVDEMSEGSFPASDPPAVWTWDVVHTDDTPAG